MSAKATLLVCRSERCAGEIRAAEYCRHIATFAREHGTPVEAFAVKCADVCGDGPHVVVHGAGGVIPEAARAPDGGVAYARVNERTLERILVEHVVGGAPVVDALAVVDPARRP